MTRSKFMVAASTLVCMSAFLGTAVAGTRATTTNYTVRFHDTATWPSVGLACELVDTGASVPLVCHSTSPGKAAGVMVTRSKITVYDKTGKVVFGWRR
jgi:hypothetical protein